MRTTVMPRSVALIAFLVSCGFSVSASADSTRRFKHWTVHLGDGLYIALTENDSGAGLGIMCSANNCVAFVSSDISCDPNQKTPVLVNSDSAASYIWHFHVACGLIVRGWSTAEIHDVLGENRLRRPADAPRHRISAPQADEALAR